MTNPKMNLEICVDSFESAKNAYEGGADRIELCSALSEGGLTPSPGLFHQIKSKLNIHVFVLIRPRSGDFHYSADEIDIMSQDITYFKQNDADGFVIGALDKNNDMDFKSIKKLTDIIESTSKTFHRAIDISADPLKIIDQCIILGFDRILSSGFEKTAVDGLKNLDKMIKHSDNRISIMPGAGINEMNVGLFKNLNVTDIHMSLRNNVHKIDSLGFSEQLYIADLDKIKQVRRFIQGA